MSIYSIVILLLLSFAIALSISIFRAMKSLNSHHATYTAFPPEFLNSPKNYTKSYSKQFEEYSKNKKRMKVDSVTKTISPISAKDFSCFDLPDVNKETPVSISSAIVQPVTTPSLEERTIQAGITNPIEKSDDEIVEEELQIELDLPAAEPENQKSEQKSITTKDDDDSYSPELVSELRIAPNKGFYLTTIDDGSFALFGYIKEKVFFLQKFTDLTQVNLQARFYDRKNGNDLYIVKIDSYKVMLAVSDTEIKELAVI